MSASSSSLERLPDLVVLGAMKCGTTTLYRWLACQPNVHEGAVKEPEFFASERAWSRGRSWYAGLFAQAPPSSLVLEASVAYLDPRVSERAAGRMKETIPRARLIAIVRDPIDRMISHHRHESLKARERRPFARAVESVDSAYVRRSLYFRGLRPYLDSWPPERLLVLGFDELLGSSDEGWRRTLAFLELPGAERPRGAFNRTDDKPQYTWLMRFLYDSGMYPRLSSVPAPLKGVGKRFLLRTRSEPAASREDVPRVVRDALNEDRARLRERLGERVVDWHPA